MPRCEFCSAEALPLTRTSTRVWLGCPSCHQTWNVDVEGFSTESSPNAIASSTSPSERRAIARGCLIAALGVTLALTLRFLLRPALGDASPFLLFTPAVAIAAVYGGVTPAALATALSTALGSHFFLIAPGEPIIEKWDRVMLFVIVSAVITGSTSLLRRSRQQLAESLWREQKARARAEAADRTKDDFLALISHELQTPLSVVLGRIAGLRRQRMNPEAVDHALDAIERNAHVLNRLVDDVLDRSRIATGTLRLDPQLVSLNTVVAAAIDQMRGKIDAGGLLLDLSTPASDPAIFGDSIRLQQVLANLLTNAVKFTDPGGHVSVTVTQANDRARIVVADTGHGMRPDLLPHIFDAFRQGPETLAQSARGLGLGLAISRHLIERHEGTISAASGGPGRGSTFTITLPLAGRPYQPNPQSSVPLHSRDKSPFSIH